MVWDVFGSSMFPYCSPIAAVRCSSTARPPLPRPEILNQHQIAARLVVLIKDDVTGIGRNAYAAVERPLCYDYRVVLTRRKAEEPNESLLSRVWGRSVIYAFRSDSESDREALGWS